MQQQKNTKTDSQEITFRELLIIFREYFNEILKHWKIILLISFVIMLFFGLSAWNKKPVYPAKLTFMINQDSGNPLGSLSGVLGTFGIGTRGKSNLVKILELSRSRRIIQNVLFKKSVINNREDILANHLINNWDTLGQWNKKAWYSIGDKGPDSLTSFRFKEKMDVGSETGKLALKLIHGRIAGNVENQKAAMLETGFGEDSRIMFLKVESGNQDLSMLLTNYLFDELSDFYIEKSIEKQKNTFDILKSKTDSIEHLLEKKELQVARLEDSWLGSYSSKSKLQQQKLNKEIRLLNIALGESIKNLEIADFAVKSTTPYIQLIDRPMKPLKEIKDSWIRKAVLGFVLASFFSILFIAIRKMARDALMD